MKSLPFQSWINNYIRVYRNKQTNHCYKDLVLIYHLPSGITISQIQLYKYDQLHVLCYGFKSTVYVCQKLKVQEKDFSRRQREGERDWYILSS